MPWTTSKECGDAATRWALQRWLSCTSDADKRLLNHFRDDGSTYAVLEILEHGGSDGVSIRHCEGEQPGIAPGVAPVRQQVTLEIGHCWIEPITFEGQAWAVASEQQHGWGDGPQQGLTGRGTALRTSPTQVDYVEHGFNALTFYPEDDPRTELPGGGGCN